jgi:AcrR family transcriptional regulator
MSGRREEHKRQTKAAIMEAAIALFNEQGYDRTSIQDLADRAGIGKATVYSYFRNKSAIVLAFCEGKLDQMSRDLVAEAMTQSTLLAQLLTYFLGDFELIYNNGEFGRILMREMLFPSSPILRAAITRFDDRNMALWVPCFKAAQQRGELRKDIELTLAMGHFYALYIMTISAWYNDRLRTKDDVAQALEMLFEQAMAGLRAISDEALHDKGNTDH